MNKSTYIPLGIAFVCLLFGLIFPWVRFAPPTEKMQNLADLATLLNRTESLPQVVQLFLQEHGWDAPRDVAGLQTFFIEDLALGESFTHLYEKNWLFSWDFFHLPAMGIMRFLIIALVGLCLGAGAVLAFLFQQHVSRPNPLDAGDLPEAEIEVASSLPSGITIILAVLSITAVVLLFLFVFQLPLLDTLGHAGNRALSLAGLMLGARITFVPRLLVPAGLLALILAGVEPASLLLAGRNPSFAEDGF